MQQEQEILSLIDFVVCNTNEMFDTSDGFDEFDVSAPLYDNSEVYTMELYQEGKRSGILATPKTYGFFDAVPEDSNLPFHGITEYGDLTDLNNEFITLRDDLDKIIDFQGDKLLYLENDLIITVESGGDACIITQHPSHPETEALELDAFFWNNNAPDLLSSECESNKFFQRICIKPDETEPLGYIRNTRLLCVGAQECWEFANKN